jgi:hypothetical protein
MAETNPSNGWLASADVAAPAGIVPSRAQEKVRQRAVNVAILIYLIIVLEGVVRKYILPDMQQPLVFLRDPFIFYLYFLAFANGLVKKSVFLIAAFFLFLPTLLMIVPNSIATGESPIFVLFGLRQYFFIIPLPFVIAEIFHHDDLQRFFRINLILVVLMVPLMVLQVFSPGDSIVNTGGALNADLAFGNLSTGDFVRAPGFFTATIALNLFLPFVGAILLFIWMVPRSERPCSPPLFAVAAFATMVAVSTSGSRGVILGLLGVAAAALMLPLIMPGRLAGGRAVIAAAVFTIGGLVTFLALFPDQFLALSDRWGGDNAESGNGSFNLIYRIFYQFAEFTEVLPNAPFLGFGLGMGSNAANILVVAPTASFAQIMDLVENDWSRHIVDLGPIIGIGYIVFRIVFTIHLGIIAVQSAIRYSDPRPWLIFPPSALIY